MAKETLGLANLQFRAKYPSFHFTPSVLFTCNLPSRTCVHLVFSSSRHFCLFHALVWPFIFFLHNFCVLTAEVLGIFLHYGQVYIIPGILIFLLLLHKQLPKILGKLYTV